MFSPDKDLTENIPPLFLRGGLVCLNYLLTFTPLCVRWLEERVSERGEREREERERERDLLFNALNGSERGGGGERKEGRKKVRESLDLLGKDDEGGREGGAW